MPRSTVFQAESVTIDKTPFLAIVKYLRDDAGELERAKGGLWVNLDGETDAVLARLSNACEQALAFATACESKHAEILRVAESKSAPKPKSARAPKNPAPAAPVAPTQAPAPVTPAAPTQAPAPKSPARQAVIDKARADRAKLATNGVGKVGSTVRDTGKPAPVATPEEQAEQDVLRQYGLA